MPNEPLSAAELDALRAFDTPTICNALEVVAPERRALGFTTQTLICPFPELPPIVGYARTAMIRSALPPGLSAAEQRKAGSTTTATSPPAAAPRSWSSRTSIRASASAASGARSRPRSIRGSVARAWSPTAGCATSTLGARVPGAVRQGHAVARLGARIAHGGTVDVFGMVVRSDDRSTPTATARS